MKKFAIFLGCVLLFAAIAAALLFGYNRMGVEVTLNGPAQQVLEYGQSYEEQGAAAAFRGVHFFRAGWPVDLTQSGSVDDGTLGTYTLTYHAEKWLWSDEKTRTVTISDTTPPELTLTSVEGHYTLPGQPYEEEGYAASDLHDGDLTAAVTAEERDGKVTYTVSDSSGNQTRKVREIFYDDPVPPQITLLGDAEITMYAGGDFTDPGAEASDNVDGDLTGAITVEGSVDSYQAGTYTLTYSVADGWGNTASCQRTVTVKALRQPDHVTPEGKIVYLTFDDGPGPYTEELLAVLEKYNVKATFFTVDTKYADLIAKEAAAGHSVGIHSATHIYSVIYQSEEAYFDDLNRMQSVIEAQTGKKTTLLRFPGGSSNTVSRSYCVGIMTKLVQDVTDQGYQYFDWNVTSGDAGETTDTEQVFQNVISGIQQHDVSIVLQHDIRHFSVEAVDRIIAWGLTNGYTFLPLQPSSPTAHHGVNN